MSAVSIQMNKSSILTQTDFEDLLQWLDRDRDRAGQKYEQIRRTLVKLFAARGCYHADDLADETLTRVARKAGMLAATYEGDPSLFFYGVAKNVHHEYLKSMARDGRVDASIAQDRMQHVAGAAGGYGSASPSEERLECLVKCLRGLPDDERQLVTKYYEQEKRAKIDSRKALAEQNRLSMNALRLKACRLRQSLRQCVVKCMENNF